jgi:acyl carrier protein
MSDTGPSPIRPSAVTDTDRTAPRRALLEIVRNEIESIAPDVDAATLSGDVDYRDEVGLDSMDFLALLTAIERRTGVSIPEVDYVDIATLDDLIEYLIARTATPPVDG